MFSETAGAASTGPGSSSLVHPGARFIDGKLVERDDAEDEEQTDEERAA